MSEQDLEFLDYIEESSKVLKSLEDEKSNLQTKLAELKEEKVILEKVASQPTFNPDKLSETLNLLAEKRMIDPEYKEKVAAIVEEKPERILELMTKLANISHESGRSIDRSADSENSEDPDGWGEIKNLR